MSSSGTPPLQEVPYAAFHVIEVYESFTEVLVILALSDQVRETLLQVSTLYKERASEFARSYSDGAMQLPPDDRILIFLRAYEMDCCRVANFMKLIRMPTPKVEVAVKKFESVNMLSPQEFLDLWRQIGTEIAGTLNGSVPRSWKQLLSEVIALLPEPMKACANERSAASYEYGKGSLARIFTADAAPDCDE